jgi:hypothetical protein
VGQLGLSKIGKASWIPAKEWNIYFALRDSLWLNSSAQEGNPENSRQRADEHGEIVVFERNVAQRPRFLSNR